MGLSRRQFTRDFKLTAVRQLEQGIPVGEVARALEVNPNVLHRWRREVRQGPGDVFPGGGNRRWLEAASQNWSGRSAAMHWRSIF